MNKQFMIGQTFEVELLVEGPNFGNEQTFEFEIIDKIDDHIIVLHHHGKRELIKLNQVFDGKYTDDIQINELNDVPLFETQRITPSQAI